MKFYKAFPPNAKVLGKSIAIYNGPGPVDAVRITASIGGIQNPWINKVWSEFIDTIPKDSVSDNADLGFVIEDVKEIEPNKVYHIQVQFFKILKE